MHIPFVFFLYDSSIACKSHFFAPTFGNKWMENGEEFMTDSSYQKDSQRNNQKKNNSKKQKPCDEESNTICSTQYI